MEDVMTVFMMLFIVYLLPIILGVYWAKQKNRDALKTFLVCLLLGWFGLIVVALLQSKKRCVECASAIPSNAFVCSFCGYDIRSRRSKK